MAPAAVRSSRAAAQEAESAYDWYAERNPSAAHGFREELRHALAGTSSRDFPSAWYTGCSGTESKSSPWRTGGAGQATGGRDSDPPSNPRMQRPALRAADPAR